MNSAALMAGLLFGAAAVAQQLDPALQQAVANRKLTLGDAQQYTYVEHKVNRAKGKPDTTDTWDIIFLEGAPYQKHVAHDDKPLPPKEQAAEEKKLANVAEARRRSKGKGGLFHPTFTLALPVDHLEKFAISPLPSQQLDGRTALVFKAIPQPGAGGIKEMAREGLAYEMTIWVDEKDRVLSRVDAKVVAGGMRFGNGSLIGWVWTKVNDEAWLPARFWYKGNVRFMKMDLPAETEQTYYDYRKFSVNANIEPAP